MKITPPPYTVISETINDHKRWHQDIATKFLNSDDFVEVVDGVSEYYIISKRPLLTRSDQTFAELTEEQLRPDDFQFHPRGVKTWKIAFLNLAFMKSCQYLAIGVYID